MQMQEPRASVHKEVAIINITLLADSRACVNRMRGLGLNYKNLAIVFILIAVYYSINIKTYKYALI